MAALSDLQPEDAGEHSTSFEQIEVTEYRIRTWALAATGLAESCVVLQLPEEESGSRIGITMLRDHQLLCAALKTILGSNAREKLRRIQTFESCWIPSL